MSPLHYNLSPAVKTNRRHWHRLYRLVLFVCLSVCMCICLSVCLCRSDCGGPCLSTDDSPLSSPVDGHRYRPRDLDAAGCHDDACCVAKSLLIHDDSVVRCSSPQAVVTSGCVVFSSKSDQHRPTSVTCDHGDQPVWQLAQSPSRSADDDVQYYVIDRRKLARSCAVADDVKQLCPRDNSASLAGRPLAGECRPLLVLPPGECCRNQRYSLVPAGVDSANDNSAS